MVFVFAQKTKQQKKAMSKARIALNDKWWVILISVTLKLLVQLIMCNQVAPVLSQNQDFMKRLR